MRSWLARNRRSVMVSWLISYTLILLIPIILNVVIYVNTLRIVSNQITDSSTYMLRQIQMELDNNLTDVQSLSLRIGVSSDLNTLLTFQNQTDALNKKNMTTLMNINQDFETYTTSNSIIQSFFLYYFPRNLVWDSTFYTKEEYFRNYFAGTQSEADWNTRMSKTYSGDDILVPALSSQTAQKTLMHFQTIPIDGSTATANLVVVYDQSKLTASLRNVGRSSHGTVYILDKDDTLLAAGSSVSAKDRVTYDRLSGDMGILHDHDRVLTYISSGVNKWKYVCVIPNSVFSQRFLYLRTIMIVCMLFCLLLGGAMIWLLARRNYNPLQELLNLIGQGKENALPKQWNESEFGWIRSSFVTVQQQKDRMQSLLDSQAKAVRMNIINRLLHGRVELQLIDDTVWETYHIAFISHYFAVAAFFLEESGETDPAQGAEDETVSNRNRLNAIAQTLRSALGASYEVFESDPEDLVILLINIPAQRLEGWNGDVKQALTETQKAMRQNCGWKYTVSFSLLVENIRDIYIGYDQAMEAMENRFTSPEQPLFSYEDYFPVKRIDSNSMYSQEEEEKLINSIRVGNFPCAGDQVNQIIQRSLSSHPNLTHIVPYAILNSYMNALSGGDALRDNQAVIQKSMERITRVHSLEEIRTELTRCLKTICEYMEQYTHSQNSAQKHVVTRIRKIVEEQYPDQNLSISSIADQLNMNAKYMSNVYREFGGESVPERINLVRIERAKELLRQHQSISKTAEEVGFCNSNALIRTFKKYLGITPGQYKDQCG